MIKFNLSFRLGLSNLWLLPDCHYLFGHSQLVILDDDPHEENIDDEERVVDQVDLIEYVLSQMLNQEAMVRPSWQAEQMDHVNANTHDTFKAKEWLLNDAIVDANEGDYAEIPKEILLSHYFVEDHERPCLNEHGEE